MDLSEENKILLLILLVAVAFWLFSGKFSDKKVENKISNDVTTSNNFDDKTEKKQPEKFEPFEQVENNIAANDPIPESSQESVESASTSNENSQEQRSEKSQKQKNDFKASSFRDGVRSNKNAEIDKFFEGNFSRYPENNNGFSPMIENDIGAAYTSNSANLDENGKPKKLSDKEKFNPDSLLPREKNNEWMDDPYEQVNVKSSTLSPANANIFRPIGINTVQSTKKIAFRDIRGVPKAPKLNVSPWNMSSVDGDNNIRNDSLCL